MRNRLALVAALAASTLLLLGADHRDAPSINYDATADLNDLYVFANPNLTDNVILVLTVNPFSAPGNAHTFAPDVLYQFKIDNTGDFREDLLIQATFTKAVPGTTQMLTLRGPAPKRGGKSTRDRVRSGSRVPVLTGAAGEIITDSATGIRAFAGLRDDPFFFDSTAVSPFLGLNAMPTPARSPLAGGNDPRDFFGGFNITALVVEVPDHLLQGSQGDLIRVWSTTSRHDGRDDDSDDSDDSNRGRTFTQVERTALPAYNTVFIPNGARGGYDLKPGTDLPNPPSRQDAVNLGAPVNDLRDFFPDVLATAVVLDTLGDLSRYGTVLSSDPNDTILARIQRDVATFQLGNLAGFEALNGRRLADDVIGILLALGSGIPGADDGVTGNDVAPGVNDPVSGLATDATGFLPDFPFLAPPKPPSLVIPPRGGN